MHVVSLWSLVPLIVAFFLVKCSEEPHRFSEWTIDKVKDIDDFKIKHRQCIVCGYVEKAVPSYFFENDYLINKIQTIKNNSLYESGLTFSFITDFQPFVRQ